jgi:ureidoacrylate peracid hydrolase
MLDAELVDPARSAMLVVDVQNDYCHPDGALGKQGLPTDVAMAMIPRLQSLLDAARASAARVIFIQTVHTDETDSPAWVRRSAGISASVCRAGTWGAQFTGVEPGAGDIVVVKHRYSAFVNTRLDTVLRTFRIENVIMTGVSTNVCVESTARDAYMRDYNVTFVSDCTAAYAQEDHDATLRTMARNFGTVATAAAIMAAWEPAASARSIRALG